VSSSREEDGNVSRRFLACLLLALLAGPTGAAASRFAADRVGADCIGAGIEAQIQSSRPHAAWRSRRARSFNRQSVLPDTPVGSACLASWTVVPAPGRDVLSLGESREAARPRLRLHRVLRR
jgi:hypothetical protein